MPERQALTVDASGHGQRLDRWLADSLPARSRSEIQRWIKDGQVLLDGLPGKAGARLAIGQQIQLNLPDVLPPSALVAEELPLAIVYEDGDLLVIDKPAGMVVHPAPGHGGGTLVNAVLHHCPDIAGVGGERRPGIVHRLDKETSGLIVVAKNDRAHRSLQAQFKARTVYKEYLALLEGVLEPPAGRITAPIGRHPVERKRMAVLTPEREGVTPGSARIAVTEYHVLKSYTATIYGRRNSAACFCLVRAVLLTGRTHQIRVHFAWLKHPVVGDTLYGFRTPRLPLARQFLHAHQLRFRLPSSGDEVAFTAPLPEELEGVLARLGGDR